LTASHPRVPQTQRKGRPQPALPGRLGHHRLPDLGLPSPQLVALHPAIDPSTRSSSAAIAGSSSSPQAHNEQHRKPSGRTPAGAAMGPIPAEVRPQAGLRLERVRSEQGGVALQETLQTGAVCPSLREQGEKTTGSRYHPPTGPAACGEGSAVPLHRLG
jgi:hypothetical protein